MKEVDQSIYDAIFSLLSSEGFTVFPFLPDLGTSYPFVVLGGVNVYPKPLKNGATGRVAMPLHFWFSIENRKLVSDSVARTRELLTTMIQADNFQYFLEGVATSMILIDDSTDEKLYHGILEVSFKYVKGE